MAEPPALDVGGGSSVPELPGAEPGSDAELATMGVPVSSDAVPLPGWLERDAGPASSAEHWMQNALTIKDTIALRFE